MPQLIKHYPLMLMGKVIAVLATAKSDKDNDNNEYKDEQHNKIKKHEKQRLKWLCADMCKLLTENDIKAIIEIRQ